MITTFSLTLFDYANASYKRCYLHIQICIDTDIVMVYEQILVALHSFDMLYLLPYPRRQGGAKVVAKLDVEVVISLVWNPVDGDFVLSFFLQSLDGGSQRLSHGSQAPVLVPSTSSAPFLR